MIEYEYEELFANHNQADLLIVRHGATLEWNSSTNKFDITDSNYVITNEEMDSESFELDERLCSNDNLKFGKCEAAYTSFTIYNRTTIPNLKDEIIDIYLYFNNNGATLFQIGVYVVEEDEYAAGRKQRNISAYDWNYTLYDLDITDWYNNYFKTYDSSSVYRQTIWVIADLFKWVQGVAPYDGTDKLSKASPELPVELDENFVLTNGAFSINKTIESDTITFGMFMEGLLEFNGAFGHITRQGKFKILIMEWYDADPVRIVTDETRIPPTNYDDISTWGIGQIDVYDRNNVRKFRVRNTAKKYPSTYVMIDPWILADRDTGNSTVQSALERMQTVIYHLNYRSCDVDCTGDLCVEVGDRINVTFEPTEGDTRNWFRSYVLERHFRGLQGMFDAYSAKGDKKQPKYKVTNDRWHNGDSESSIQGAGGVSELDTEHDRLLIQKLRNIGIRMLNEPSNVAVVYNKQTATVDITWTDPVDIDDYKPHPCEWVGTVVIRKEGEAPIHRWDGERIVLSTTRDEYSETPFSDDTIQPNKKYYYAIMPYYIALDDADHPIRHYTWTKVISVDTERIIMAPTLASFVADGTTAQAGGLLPALEDGSYAHIIFGVKKGSIPASVEDSDYTVEVEEPQTVIKIIGATFSGLDENSTYYCVIFIEDDIGLTASSEPLDCKTGIDEGWNFGYTGTIQEFTAPKTGYYSLETWGAQGGDATDGTNTARGGYGAYAYGEVLLQQGETIYINVGGQNGYGGGGFNSLEIDAFTQFKGTDISTRVFCGDASGTMFDASNCAEANQSGELLSNKIFYAQGEGVTPTIDTQNKEVRYPANPDGNTHPYSVNLIPIIRNSDAHYIKCTAVRTTDVSANYRTAYFELSAYYVENGELKVGTNTYIQNPTFDSEIEVSLNVSSLSYIDYIGFGTTKDAWTIKNIIIDTTPSE